MNVNLINYSKYHQHFNKLIQIEREEEMRRHEMEIRSMTGKERQQKGRTILGLRGKFLEHGLGGSYIYQFNRDGGLPDTEISVGDLVIVSSRNIDFSEPQGTVVEKGKYHLNVTFTRKPPGYVKRGVVRIDLFTNDVTYQRMFKALELLKKNSKLQNVLFGKVKINFNKIKEISVGRLNKYQKQAVKKTVEAQDFFLVHGPPGTGKTTTLVESITQHVKLKNKVLVTADSNIAVDNLVEKLSAKELNVVRVGNPARMLASIHQHSLDFLIQQIEAFKKAQNLYEKLDKLKDERLDYMRPTGKTRRGLSDEKILEIADKGSSVRGIKNRTIKSMANYIMVQDEMNEIFNKAKEYEDVAVEAILDAADVICTTNSTAGSDVLDNYEFDVVFIDEATQATEPSCLISLVKGSKFIMAGDHKQLPPTILSLDAAKGGLDYSAFERLLDVYGNEIKKTLRVQYRMHKNIMEFPNMSFYESKLEAAPAVREHTLEDFNLDTSKLKSTQNFIRQACKPETVNVFIDVENSHEELKIGSTSIFNQTEAEMVQDIAAKFLEMGLKPEQLGVITPYDAQRNLLQDLISNDSVQIKTVDGFQGREKEVIIISLVRSNSERELGFLRDKRRLNVALTRAKRKLIILGNSKTLVSDPIYKKLIESIKSNGSIVHAS